MLFIHHFLLQFLISFLFSSILWMGSRTVVNEHYFAAMVYINIPTFSVVMWLCGYMKVHSKCGKIGEKVWQSRSGHCPSKQELEVNLNGCPNVESIRKAVALEVNSFKVCPSPFHRTVVVWIRNNSTLTKLELELYSSCRMLNDFTRISGICQTLWTLCLS